MTKNNDTDPLRQEQEADVSEDIEIPEFPETGEVAETTELRSESSPLLRVREGVSNVIAETRNQIADKTNALIGIAKEKYTGLNENFQCLKEDVFHVITDTRNKIADSTKALIGMTKEKCAELKGRFHEMLAKLPSPVAAVLTTMITIAPGGIYLLIPNAANAAASTKDIYAGTGLTPIDDYGNPIKEFLGSAAMYTMIEAALIAAYGGIGMIGYRGKAWDDAGRAVGIGLLFQALATVAAWGLSMGCPLLWGVGGGLGATSFNAVRKVIRNRLTKSTGGSTASPIRKSTKRRP